MRHYLNFHIGALWQSCDLDCRTGWIYCIETCRYCAMVRNIGVTRQMLDCGDLRRTVGSRIHPRTVNRDYAIGNL